LNLNLTVSEALIITFLPLVEDFGFRGVRGDLSLKFRSCGEAMV